MTLFYYWTGDNFKKMVARNKIPESGQRLPPGSVHAYPEYPVAKGHTAIPWTPRSKAITTRKYQSIKTLSVNTVTGIALSNRGSPTVDRICFDQERPSGDSAEQRGVIVEFRGPRKGPRPLNLPRHPCPSDTPVCRFQKARLPPRQQWDVWHRVLGLCA